MDECGEMRAVRRHLFYNRRAVASGRLLWNFPALEAYVTRLDEPLLNRLQKAQRWSFAWQCELKRN